MAVQMLDARKLIRHLLLAGQVCGLGSVRLPRELQMFHLYADYRNVSLYTRLRGIGYDWGIKGQLIPQSFTPQNFIREYLFMVLRAHILLILAITACQIYFRSSESDFLRSLGVSGLPLQSIMSRICLGIVFGSAVWNFLDLAYACLALFAKLGTATLQKLPLLPEIFKPAPFNPRAWPPLLRNPLVSDNLADFWTYRWHS